MKALWDYVSLSGGEIIGKVGGFVAFAYLARTLTPASFGGVEYAFALLGFFAVLTDFGLGSIGAREVAGKPQTAANYVALIPAARIVLALVSVVLMCLIALVSDIDEASRDLVLVLSFSLFTLAWNQAWLFQGQDKFHSLSVLTALKMLAFAVLVIWWVQDPSDLVYVGFAETGVAFTIALFWMWLQVRAGFTIDLRFEPSRLKQLYMDSGGIGGANVLWSLSSLMLALLVVTLAGAVELAWFAAAGRIQGALSTFSRIYHFSLYSSVVRSVQAEDGSFEVLTDSSLRLTAFLGCLLALTIALISPTLVIWVFGDQYMDAAIPLQVLIWVLPVSLISGHARWFLVANYQQKQLFKARGLGLAATLLLGVFLIPLYGALAASWAVLVGSLATWVAVQSYARARIGFRRVVSALRMPVLLSAFGLAFLNSDFIENSFIVLASVLCAAAICAALDRMLLQSVVTLAKIKSDST